VKIQKNIVKRAKRGVHVISQLFHAKKDKETIATWRLDPNRILHIFNVRWIVSVWVSLTVHFQTELAINTHVTAVSVSRTYTQPFPRSNAIL